MKKSKKCNTKLESKKNPAQEGLKERQKIYFDESSKALKELNVGDEVKVNGEIEERKLYLISVV